MTRPPDDPTTSPRRLLPAAWVAPMDRPPFRYGADLIDGNRIADVGAAAALSDRHPDAETDDLGDVVLVPGLVNAHTHLELSLLKQAEPPTSLADWLIRLLSRARGNPAHASRDVLAAVGEGVAQCLRFGVTTVGDVSAQFPFTRPLLRKSPLRVVSYGEVRAMATRRPLTSPRIAAAADRSEEAGKLTVGLTPHAPYSVEIDGYRECVRVATEHGMPLATHLAESTDEAPFLEHHAGRFRELWERIGGWDEHVPRFAGGPVRFAKAVGLLDVPTLLAHVNYVDDAELDLLATSRASVVYCPRTHAYFGHAPHRWREMLARGINVAIGTDSCASSPDLNPLDDARLLRRLAPDLDPLAIWRMATLRAARALGVDASAGTLTAGKAADIVAFPATTDAPLAEVLDSAVLPAALWIDGRRRIDHPSAARTD